MRIMFYTTMAFNQLIRNWDVSSVTTMSHMLGNRAFNQPIGIWDVLRPSQMDA